MFPANLTAPVFSFSWLRNRSHHTPIEIKLVVMFYDGPDGFCHPRETLVPRRVQRVVSHFRGYRYSDSSAKVAHDLGDSVLHKTDGTKAASNHLPWL